MIRAGFALKSFGRFLWKFIVGDDLTLAIGVLLGAIGVAVAARSTGAAWLILPLLWVVALFISLRRATRRNGA